MFKGALTALLLCLVAPISGAMTPPVQPPQVTNQDLEDRDALAAALQAQLGGGLPGLVGAALGGSSPLDGDGSAETEPAPGPAPPAFTEMAGGRFEFHARNLPVADAIAQLRQLVRRNIVVAPEVASYFTGDLYDVTVEQVLDAICASAGLIYREQNGFIFVERDKPETRIFELGHARGADVVAIVQPLLSPLGQISATPAAEAGIESTPDAAGGNDYAYADIVVVTDFKTTLDQIAEVIAVIDESPMQVLIEATIIAVNLTDQMEMGVEFTALGGVDFEDAGATSADGLSFDYGDPAFDGQELDDGVGNVTTNLLEGIATGGLNIGYLKDGISVFLRALEQVTEATVMANPRIMTMNKQRGEVLLGRRDGYLQSIVTETSTTQQVEFLETGTRLIYRPFIMGDGLVRLEIHPEDSSGGLNADGLPFKETAEITTNITVRSGETVVVGGLFREKTLSVKSSVPVLGDIPGVGALFRSESDEAIRQEVLIVITPHILDPNALSIAPGPGDGLEPSGIEGVGVQPVSADVAQREAVRNAIAGRRPQRLVPGPTADNLAHAYLTLATSLVERGEYGSAAILLDSLGPLGQQAQVDDMRRRLWQLWSPPVKDSRLDDLILQRMVDGSLGQGGG